MPAVSRSEYEESLHSLAQCYPEVTGSTLRLYSNSAATAYVRGSVYLANGLELRVFEYLDLTDGEILDYSYTVYRGADKIRWYDPQPHPEDPALTETAPHHYHMLPDIKHNRHPAPGVTFQAPNLSTLVSDCMEQ